jgi:transcriptional regulator with XRE-family HTH domain
MRTTLGQRLQDRRIRAKLNETQLAHLIGYDQSGSARIREYEAGRRTPTLQVLQRLAAAFDTTVSQLLRGVM